ncbi:hypothetical protein EG872_15565 [Enterococcus faecalis]|nr:hypothetical protein EG872_15565 [Enterococcus faecalis]
MEGCLAPRHRGAHPRQLPAGGPRGGADGGRGGPARGGRAPVRARALRRPARLGPGARAQQLRPRVRDHGVLGGAAPRGVRARGRGRAEGHLGGRGLARGAGHLLALPEGQLGRGGALGRRARRPHRHAAVVDVRQDAVEAPVQAQGPERRVRRHARRARRGDRGRGAVRLLHAPARPHGLQPPDERAPARDAGVRGHAVPLAAVDDGHGRRARAPPPGAHAAGGAWPARDDVARGALWAAPRRRARRGLGLGRGARADEPHGDGV